MFRSLKMIAVSLALVAVAALGGVTASSAQGNVEAARDGVPHCC